MVADNFDTERTDFAPGVAGSHATAGSHTELGRQAAFGTKVDNLFESEAQSTVLEPVEVGPYVLKVDLVGFEMDLVGQQGSPAGHQVVHAPPRVVLAERMTELAGSLVDAEVGQLVQVDDEGRPRVDLAVLAR